MKIVFIILLVLGLAVWLRPRDKAGWLGLCVAIIGAVGTWYFARKALRTKQRSESPYPTQDAWERLEQGRMR